MKETAPCAEHVALFDSRRMADHRRARAYCATCPMLSRCLRSARAQSRGEFGAATGIPDGTWGGRLWRDGHMVELEAVSA